MSKSLSTPKCDAKWKEGGSQPLQGHLCVERLASDDWIYNLQPATTHNYQQRQANNNRELSSTKLRSTVLS